ncbi:hypothetical protein [Desulfoferrobacter suflitae]|uniref:hypothetical protein n=1 Tax=Desulfoferrobacter suflitae TaxID=2865782 RepID=UPI0021642017|nr:hypothetical protein [Desulfoferrobacter suflitae]MCK8603197.1 hypothetical protein [Desulfoferrobacter suflitae]
MIKSSSGRPQEGDTSVREAKDRANEADRIYQEVCDDLGMRVCSWQSFAAWQEYLDAKISEADLTERARDELQQFSETFGKYLVIEKTDQKYEQQETEKKERAKRANKIYKQICDDSGIQACFFRDFSSWSEYVKGAIDETEFYDRARSEVEKMLSEGAPVQ